MLVMKHYELADMPDIQKVGVYAIHNKKTGRYYIGSTKNLYHRFTLHMRSLRHLGGINRKMDEDFQEPENFNDFEWIIIEMFEDNTITNWDLRLKEWHYIDKYNAITKGYNTDIPTPGNIPRNELLVAHDYMSEKQKQSIMFYLPRYLKEKYKAHAAAQGKSLNALIIDLLEKKFTEMQENGGD